MNITKSTYIVRSSMIYKKYIAKELNLQLRLFLLLFQFQFHFPLFWDDFSFNAKFYGFSEWINLKCWKHLSKHARKWVKHKNCAHVF